MTMKAINSITSYQAQPRIEENALQQATVRQLSGSESLHTADHHSVTNDVMSFYQEDLEEAKHHPHASMSSASPQHVGPTHDEEIHQTASQKNSGSLAKNNSSSQKANSNSRDSQGKTAAADAKSSSSQETKNTEGQHDNSSSSQETKNTEGQHDNSSLPEEGGLLSLLSLAPSSEGALDTTTEESGVSATSGLASSLPAPVAMAVRSVKFSNLLDELVSSVDSMRLNVGASGRDIMINLSSKALGDTNILISGNSTHLEVAFSTLNAASNTLLNSNLTTLQNHLAAICPGQFVEVRTQLTPSNSSTWNQEGDQSEGDLASFDRRNRGDQQRENQ